MAAAAAPAVAEAAGGAAAAGGSGAAAGGARAGASGASKGAGGAGKGGGKGGGLADALGGAGGTGGGKGGAKKSGAAKSSKALSGAAGKYRKMMIAEFIVCVMLLGLSPLAKGSGEMGPTRFMKRGSATCAFFIILGLISSAGRGAARAAAMFGALVTLVLLVDQREAFGKLATTLAVSKDDDAKDAADQAAAQGPDDSTSAGDNPGVGEA
jgi:hypothetical protein